jgi:transketolase
MPNLRVIRPADANETAAAWALALRRLDGPTALVLTRQNLPIFEGTALGKGVERGAYVLEKEQGGEPEILLLASGSEVSLALEAAKLLKAKGVRARVVSMPCWDLFEQQPEEYRRSVLPPAVRRRLAIEAAVPFGWDRYVGPEGRIHGISRFGISAPLKEISKLFGFTPDVIASEALELLGKS